jgi:hypothetical protein
MTLASLIEAFDQLDLAQLPDPHELETDRLQTLWILAGVKRIESVDTITADEVSSVLRDRFGISVSRQRVTAILDAEDGDTVARVGRKKPARFKLMEKGDREVCSAEIQPLFVDPRNALSSIRKVEAVFQQVGGGDLLICDPYVDGKTFDYLALTSNVPSIRLLTENIQGESSFRRDLKAFTKQYGASVEVRKMVGQLHDRYVIFPGGMLLFGSSIKDIGRKQSLVVRLPETFANQMGSSFNYLWNAASKFE